MGGEAKRRKNKDGEYKEFLGDGYKKIQKADKFMKKIKILDIFKMATVTPGWLRRNGYGDVKIEIDKEK